MYIDEHFKSKIISPLKVDNLFEVKVENLSGGELQKCSNCNSTGKRPTYILIR